MGGNQVVTVRGERELMARAGHLFTAARSEFLCAAADLSTWSHAELRQPIISAVHAARPAGMVVRKLFTAAVLADDDSVRHIEAVAGRGGEVRISDAPLPQETIVLDGSTALLAGPAEPERGFSVVRDPAVVSGVRTLFLASWQGAVPLAEYRAGLRPAMVARDREILELLGAGLTDETAARRLGLSLRTYRRRVAALMSLLGAESRFQAGVRARGLGL